MCMFIYVSICRYPAFFLRISYLFVYFSTNILSTPLLGWNLCAN